MEKRKSINSFMVLYFLIQFGAFFRFYENKLASYNSTVLAFSYKYGFISRGFIGTLYQGLDKILPISLQSYEAAINVTLIATLLIGLLLAMFFYILLLKTDEKYLRSQEIMILIISLVIMSTFFSKRNFGRLDIYMLLFTFLGMLCLISKKCEVLVIPFAALGVMVHQGYVFMYVNLLLVLLLYRILSAKDKEERNKYIALGIGTFAVVSALFLWFEFFSHGNGNANVDEVIRNAKKLGYNGKYHETLVQHEIQGIDISDTEVEMHICNFVETPIFLAFMIPYIVIAVKVFKDLIKGAKEKPSKVDVFKYWAVILGAATLLPCFALKVDFGRWFLALITYYCFMVISLLAMGDEFMCAAVDKEAKILRDKPYAFILIIYPMIFIPFLDVNICGLAGHLANAINLAFLNAW